MCKHVVVPSGMESSLVYASVSERRRGYGSNSTPPAIHRQATRGSWLCLCIVADGLVWDSYLSFLPSLSGWFWRWSSSILNNKCCGSKCCSQDVSGAAGCLSNEPVGVDNRSIYHTGSPTEEPRLGNVLSLFWNIQLTHLTDFFVAVARKSD